MIKNAIRESYPNGSTSDQRKKAMASPPSPLPISKPKTTDVPYPVAIDTGDGCFETWPCQHNCTITLSDGTKVENGMGARDCVTDAYWKIMKPEDQRHFKYYQTDARFGKRDDHSLFRSHVWPPESKEEEEDNEEEEDGEDGDDEEGSSIEQGKAKLETEASLPPEKTRLCGVMIRRSTDSIPDDVDVLVDLVVDKVDTDWSPASFRNLIKHKLPTATVMAGPQYGVAFGVFNLKGAINFNKALRLADCMTVRTAGCAIVAQIGL